MIPIVVIVAGALIFFVCTGTGRELLRKAPGIGANEPPKEVEFPIMLEKDQLEVNSVFQYTGANPDCEWQEGENIGALTLINHSERYLKSAELKVKLSNGETLHFTVTDIPTGKTAWLFEVENGVFPLDEYCVSVDAKAKYTKDTGLEGVTAEATGPQVTLTNTTGEDLENLTVWCHTLFNDAYFGGTVHSYPVERISKGDTAELMAVDCILGDAEVVRVEKEK